MSTKKQVKVTIEEMTPQALICRSVDHPWDDGSDENVMVLRKVLPEIASTSGAST